MYTSEKVDYDYPFYRAWKNGNSKSVNGIRELLIKGIHVSNTINLSICASVLYERSKIATKRVLA